MSANQVMSAILPPRGKPLSTPSTRQVDKPPRVPRIPRAVEFLCKALEWQALLASGQAKNQADIARQEGISRVRVTQVMWMLRLAPEIQERILAMPKMNRRPVVSERVLRPIAHLEDVMDQKTRFQELIGEVR
ncbi:MAG: hypothetical protein A3B73_03565 [Omnitrophica WOR_2 bacterium RIFCSPHIGHO2_02_FULL_63_39]|nr:MAG: hypothetical protein A2Z92_02540 [Omnitrophica WOR_2 bacterium GWA2_63_20]OGX16418.1 MAG: hypothetical protein A2105_06990 [Omnitrophica WOR_2 bacterium GWF2_63_9]OGX36868.1 MAG: hypothetical protein A3B73_03565 [Omnitrophica WOR_2 bacterium RIFCSPHIGHO2_02_FULL_63_39]OGX50107.1 MAG: hypothetical protein A3G88_02410 [Omnitrophica WOR_2 bacterium RIFCSPLOWO2_12_FULL_63_16]HAM40946.1 hypothetical protein [Candidatus Omnitrophota bacterium]